jgi:hypothetical protein
MATNQKHRGAGATYEMASRSLWLQRESKGHYLICPTNDTCVDPLFSGTIKCDVSSVNYQLPPSRHDMVRSRSCMASTCSCCIIAVDSRLVS